MTFFVLPAVDRARRRLVCDTAPTQRTCVTGGLPAHIADLDPAPGVGLAARRRLQELAERTAVSVRRGVVAEVFMAEAALRLQTPRSLGLRHISDDAVVLAGLQRRAVVVSDVSNRLQRLCCECLLRSLGHLVKLPGIVAVIDDLARNDELVLVVDSDLDIVPGDGLAVLRQQTGVCVRP